MSGARTSTDGSLAGTQPRDGTWGSAGDRDFAARLAVEIAARGGFGVCVIEVVRADATVECVAIHGTPLGVVNEVGQVRPLASVLAALPDGTTQGDLTFVPGDGSRVRGPQRPGPRARVPDPRPHEDDEAWQPGDRVLAQLRDDRNALRALVKLNLPLDGRRRQGGALRALSDELHLAFQALVALVERELLTQQVRVARVARRILRAASIDTELSDVIALVRDHMREGFLADELFVDVFDSALTPVTRGNVSPALAQGFLEAAHRAWVRDDVIIVEAGHVWGDEILSQAHAAELKKMFVDRNLGSIVLIPLGDRSQFLGTLSIVRRTGAPRWTDSETAAALDVGRDLGHALANARAAEREAGLRAELQRLYDLRTEAVGTLSHELKNPTGVILGHLEMLEAHVDLDPEVQYSLGAIERGARRIEQLCQSLLALRQLENPNHPLDARPVDMVSLVCEVIEMAELSAERSGVTLELDTPSHEVVVLGDRAELNQVVTNLVSNAIKYSDRPGQVCLRLARDGDRVELRCIDAGIGISEEDLTHLFEEFFRSTNADALHRPGNGLGLSILGRVVDRHGGSVRVESQPGHGTTFTVTLPAAN